MLAALIIAVGLLVAAVRLAVPHADQLRIVVAEQLGAQLGVRLSMDRLALRLVGSRLELTLDDALLRDRIDGERLLALDALRVTLDLVASLQAGSPRIDGITLVGADLDVYRSGDGDIRVRGLDRLGLDRLGGADGGGAMAFFLREGRLGLADSRISWTDRASDWPPLAFSVRRLQLDNRGGALRLRFEATPEGAPEAELTLLADLTGSLGAPETIAGAAYAAWRGGQIPAGLPMALLDALPAGIVPATDASELRAWLHLEGGKPVRLVGEAGLQGLILRRPNASETETLAVGDVEALVRWRREARGWRFDLPEIILRDVGNRAPTSVRARADFDGAERRIDLHLRELDIESLAEIAAFVAPSELPPPLSSLLDGRLVGDLRDLRVQVMLPDPGAARTDGADVTDTSAASEPPLRDAQWLVNGEVADLGIGPRADGSDAPIPEGPIPPVDGLDLRFTVGPRSGAVAILSEDARLDLRPHTLAPTRLTHLDGTVNWWSPSDGGWLVRSDAFTANTTDVDTASRLLLRPATDGDGLFVHLRTHLRGGDADAVTRYLPVSRMKQQLVDWLDDAIVAGTLDSGDLLLHGDLAGFPFDGRDGNFQLRLRLSDGVLDYQPPKRPTAASAENAAAETAPQTWPNLEAIEAEVRFDRRSLAIQVADARIMNTRVQSGSASLPDMWRPEVMTIVATGRGPLSDGLDFLADTPLAAKVGGIPRNLSASGDGELALTLEVPVKRGERFGFNGELDFVEGAGVLLRKDNLSVTDVEGRLRFDHRGVHADDIRGRLGEQPLRITLKSRADDAGGSTDINVTGSTPIDRIAQAAPSPWWSLVGGEIDWRFSTNLQNAAAAEDAPPLQVRLRSDLSGVSLDLPAPFGKPVNDRRTLTAELHLEPSSPLLLKGRIGDLGLAMELLRTPAGPVPERVAVDLTRTPDLPEQRGIRVAGELETLRLDDWLAWQSEHPGLFEQTDGSGEGPPVLPIELSADEVSLGAFRMQQVQATITNDGAGGWRVGAAAQANNVALALPADLETGMTLSLDSLDLAPFLSEPEGPTRARRERDPRNIIPLSLRVEALRNGDDVLGRLRLDLDRTEFGLALSDFSLSGELASIDGTGLWTRDETDFTETSVSFALRADDLGDFLRRAGYYSALSSAPSKGTLELTWPGDPGAFDLARVRGKLAAEIGAGRLLTVEPGIGRVLSILNLGAIGRRLDLDFSDVTDAGFSFDAMNGQISIGSGAARIETLTINSSTADVRIRGSTDLINGTFDQTLRVTPKIGTGVAIASAVAGGPLVGAAVLLADKVSGDAVDRLAAYEYSVTGPWSDPVIRRVAGGGTAQSAPDLLTPANPGSGNSAASTARPIPSRSPPRSPAPRRASKSEPAAAAAPPNPFLDTD